MKFLGYYHNYLLHLWASFLLFHWTVILIGEKQTRIGGLLVDSHSELVEVKNKLTGQGNLHFPDIWESAISSGQLRFLSSKQVAKLASVYKDVKGLEYEAKRTRDLAEEYQMTKNTRTHVPNDLRYSWSHSSAILKDREKKLLQKIDELLKEEWWKV